MYVFFLACLSFDLRVITTATEGSLRRAPSSVIPPVPRVPSMYGVQEMVEVERRES